MNTVVISHPMLACGHAANATDANGAPACAICICIDPGASVVADTPDLTNRTARCGCKRTRPSDPDELAFFEYCGPGSRRAHTSCKHCGYADVAHDPEHMARNVPSNRRTVVEQGKCKGFEAHGAYEFDSYYCGHAGWN